MELDIMKKLLLTAAALLGLAATTAQATPSLQITVQQGSGTILSASGSNPLITNLATTNFSVNVQIGLVDEVMPSIDLGSSVISSGNGGTLTVTLSVQGLTTLEAANQWLSQFSGNWNTPGTTVTLQTYVNAANQAVNTTTGSVGSAVLLGTLNGTSSPFAASGTSAIVSASAPFSLIEVLTITTTGAGSLSLDASIVRVPEPMSLALFGAGLLGLGGLARRNQREA
jgi:hypothetical protein